MNTAADPLACRHDGERRRLVRSSDRNGLDDVEVDDAQTTLTVHFLGRAPKWITAAHLRIEGGRRIRDLRVTGMRIECSDDDGLDDRMIVTVDRPGDFSVYRLCVVALDQAGRPTGRPPEDFDPRYACVCFSFKAGCPSDLDCAAPSTCEAPPLDEPAIDYLARDYASLRRLLLDRLSLLMPDWTERHAPDLGITLVELLAYVGDQLSYQQDAVATEAYLDTARLRVSVRRHARLVDYLLHEGCNARAWVAFEVGVAALTLKAGDFYVITQHPQLHDPVLKDQDLPRTEPAPFLGFQPRLPAGSDTLILRQARNRIGIYRWSESDCCLAQGATSATLVDPGTLPKPPPPREELEAGIARGRWHQLHLQPCEVLLFEELKGPRTGVPADADPTHRHAVRLTRAVPSYDPLTQQLLYEIEWCPEDQLPFALCLSSVSDAPACETLLDVSVAWGNVVLVDHGLDAQDELGSVPVVDTVARCEDACEDAETTHKPGRYRPRLPQPDPTFATPLAPCEEGGDESCCGGCGDSAAGATLAQDVLAALPEVTLHSLPADAAPKAAPRRWVARQDLQGSGPDDRHFVVEVDDDRVPWLRFGDGECGRAPEAGESFRCHYRVGNGSIGNVGADALLQVVFRNGMPNGAGLRVRNPLPAAGGTAPENTAEARRRIPDAFRHRLERAVTAGDYAALVMRDFAGSVQGAAAVMRASGAHVEVQIAVDAVGRATPSDALLQCIEQHLRCLRRIGHALRVVPARQVPLDVAMRICVKPGYLGAHVKAALLEVFGTARVRRPRAGGLATGFFHPDALKLGQPVSASRIVALAQSVDGVAGVVLERLERLFEGPDGELESGVLAIGPLEVARLDNDPVFPENGQLVIAMEGGR
ncbi:putative baseplate assembly protein [Variovorax sp. JS1663]|nr:putative baseplate assembly protein [Variovorax sp. JS1663]